MVWPIETNPEERCAALLAESHMVLRVVLDYFTDPDGGNPEYTERVVRNALAMFRGDPMFRSDEADKKTRMPRGPAGDAGQVGWMGGEEP